VDEREEDGQIKGETPARPTWRRESIAERAERGERRASKSAYYTETVYCTERARERESERSREAESETEREREREGERHTETQTQTQTSARADFMLCAATPPD